MDGLGWIVCIAVLVIFLVVVSVSGSRAADAKRKMLVAARDGYQRALAELKKQPNNPDVKQRALDLGRAYSNLTREQKGVTIFDEMALMNDINAATAGAGVAAPMATVSVQERLKRLDELRGAGVITDQEYAKRRQSILGEL